ncbi:MAG TPA: methyltransferase domain-containing protein [Acidimicrobiales bacterium]
MDTKSAVVAPLRKILGPAYDPLRRTELRLECMLRHRSDDALTAEAQQYWTRDDEVMPQMSHWRGAGIFGDEDRWLAMGRRHLELYGQLLEMADRAPSLRRIVEWGPGGGANAVFFAPLAERFVGIDVSPENLSECAEQLAAMHFDGFEPILIPVADPARALREVRGPAELFLCTYVFEVMPSQEYGYQVLRLAERMLVERGLALVQVKFVTRSWETRPRRFSYRRNLGHLTSYDIEEFWTAAERIGFDPIAVKLLTEDPLNENGPYAYFLLQKRETPEGVIDLRDR